MSALQRACALVIIAVAFLVRVWVLDFKPAHFDEGVNGSFIDTMRTLGPYQYDSANYHGPLHFDVLFVGQQLFGRSLWVLRMPTVLAGTALVALMLMFRRFFSFRAVALGAVFVAVSPAMTFYSRYAIHEMWMPMFAAMTCYGGCGLATGARRKGDLWWVGMGLTGMVLTKETYLLHFIAAFLALGALALFRRLNGERKPMLPPRRRRPADLFTGRRGSAETESAPPELSGADVAKVWFVSLGLIVAFYSSFGLHWQGVRGLLDTFAYMHVKGTHGESGHNKEFVYWVKLLAYYEWPALAGFLVSFFLAVPRSLIAGATLVVTGVAMLCVDIIAVSSLAPEFRPFDYLRPNFPNPDLALTTLGGAGILAMISGVGFFLAVPARDLRIRWFALYGLASFSAYSLIPYKTAWCSVNFIWVFCLVAGYALDRLCFTGSRMMVALVTVLLSVGSVQDTWHLNFVNPVNDALSQTRADKPEGDRYAYVQTTFDINRLLIPLRELVAANPRNRDLTGVILGEPFPLIWELNDFPNIRFEDSRVELPAYDADFLIVPDDRRDVIEPQLVGIYFREPYQPRGGGDASWLYLQAERFRPVLPAERTPEVKPRVPQFR